MYFMYFDINNLYDWGIITIDFQWVDDINNFNVMDVRLDSSTGYILEVDLKYISMHSDLPFCPAREKSPGKCEDKLLATLYDKKRYVIHYCNLQQCIRHSLCTTKTNRRNRRQTAISMALRL